jgi:hypothetical protein
VLIKKEKSRSAGDRTIEDLRSIERVRYRVNYPKTLKIVKQNKRLIQQREEAKVVAEKPGGVEGMLARTLSNKQ